MAPPANEEEINTVELSFKKEGADALVYKWVKNDDDDGLNEAKSKIDIELEPDTEYTLTTRFLNETEDPVEDVTVEIEEEDTDHQVFYIFKGDDHNITYAYGDKDSDGNPIGLTGTVRTGDAFTKTDAHQLQVVLKHEPKKDGEGVKGGDIANAGGETDISVTFTIETREGGA